MMLKLQETDGSWVVLDSKHIVCLLIPAVKGDAMPTNCTILTVNDKSFQLMFQHAQQVENAMAVDAGTGPVSPTVAPLAPGPHSFTNPTPPPTFPIPPTADEPSAAQPTNPA